MAQYYKIQQFVVPPPPTLDPVLNNNSWSAIQWAAQNGVASSTWSVGDRKAVTLNGTVGDKTFSNQTAYAYILGFNHNASLESNNTIHFQFGFDALTGGNHIAFCDSQYSTTGTTSAFRLNTSQTNVGGWNGSQMRNTIVPAFINAMPSDLQAVLKAVNKYTDNGTGSTHESSSDVTATSDKVFLLSEYEIFGVRKNANQYEQNSQAQYDYYKNGNSALMYIDSDTSTKCMWWGRSPYYNSNYFWVGVGTNGAVGGNAANMDRGFAPAFVVG